MKKVAITFDDGYYEDYSVVFPIFKKYKIKGTSFITTNDIGKSGYLSWDNIKEMNEYGWSFECHTHNHPQLAKLSNEDIEKEFQMVDNEFLRHSLPIPEYTAYPYNSRNNNVKKITRSYRKGARADSTGGDNYEVKSYAIHKCDVDSLFKNKEEMIKDLVMHTHDVSDKNRGYGITPEELEKTINLLIKKGYKFFTFKDYIENNSNEERIPKIIHQIWVGDNPRPKEWMDSWKEKNPDLKYMFWDEKNIKKEGLVNQHIYDDYLNIKYKSGRMYHGMADVARVEILNKYGGIYIDADTECTNPLDEGLLNTDFFGVYEEDGNNKSINKRLVSTGVIGSIPNHPILKEYIKRIGNAIVDEHAWTRTGPKLFTDILENRDVKLLQAHSFYPITIDNRPNAPCKNYGKHYWYSHNLPNQPFVIMAGGKGDRWGNHLGTPKQMVEVDGEPILKRTIRILKELGVKDIIVTVPKKGFYGKLGVKEVLGKTETEMDRFLACQEKDAVFLYGDVYYDLNLLKEIVQNDKSPMFWGRNKRGSGIGKGVLEMYAIKFNDELYKIAKKIRKKATFGGSGWNVYFYFTEGLILNNEKDRIDIVLQRTPNCPYFKEVKDITDDFDKPEDYDLWIEGYNRIKKETPSRIDCKKLDVVYPVDTRRESKILPLSIKTLKNIPYRDIFIVGKKPTNVEAKEIYIEDVEVKPLQNIITKLEAVIADSRISEDFILMNDDFFILQEYKEIPYYHRGKISEYKPNSYFAKPKEILQERFPDGKMFNVHFPMVFNKTKLKELLQKEDKNAIISSDLRSYYCNFHNIEGEYHEDHKIYQKAKIKDHADAPFLSTSQVVENTRLKEIEKIIKKRGL